MVGAEAVKALRDKTGISMAECKKALEEARGDEGRALAILRARGADMIAKKSDRALGAGAVAAYVHAGSQIGALALLSCETDFVARNEAFVSLVRDIAMHVSAMDPQSTEELLGQPFIKNPEKTIRDLIVEATQKFGERIEVGAFSRVSVK